MADINALALGTKVIKRVGANPLHGVITGRLVGDVMEGFVDPRPSGVTGDRVRITFSELGLTDEIVGISCDPGSVEIDISALPKGIGRGFDFSNIPLGKT
jgi:hypothetical protein